MLQATDKASYSGRTPTVKQTASSLQMQTHFMKLNSVRTSRQSLLSRLGSVRA